MCIFGVPAYAAVLLVLQELTTALPVQLQDSTEQPPYSSAASAYDATVSHLFPINLLPGYLNELHNH